MAKVKKETTDVVELEKQETPKTEEPKAEKVKDPKKQVIKGYFYINEKFQNESFTCDIDNVRIVVTKALMGETVDPVDGQVKTGVREPSKCYKYDLLNMISIPGREKPQPAKIYEGDGFDELTINELHVLADAKVILPDKEQSAKLREYYKLLHSGKAK